MIGNPPQTEEELYEKIQYIENRLSGWRSIFMHKRMTMEALFKKTYCTVGFVLKDKPDNWFYEISPAVLTDLTSLAYVLYEEGKSYQEVLSKLSDRLKMDVLFHTIYKRGNLSLSGNEIQNGYFSEYQRYHNQYVLHRLGFSGNGIRWLEASIAPAFCPQILINNVDNLERLGLLRLHNEERIHHISIECSKQYISSNVSNVTACLYSLRRSNKMIRESPWLYSKGLICSDSGRMVGLSGNTSERNNDRRYRWEIRAVHLNRYFYEDIWILNLLMNDTFMKNFSTQFNKEINTLWSDNGLLFDMDLTGNVELPTLLSVSLKRAAKDALQLTVRGHLKRLIETVKIRPEINNEIKTIIKKYAMMSHRSIIFNSLGADVTNTDKPDWIALQESLRQRCSTDEDNKEEILVVALSLAILNKLQVPQAEEIAKNCGIGEEFYRFRTMLELTELGVVVLKRSGSAENINKSVYRLTQHQKSTNGSVLSSN